MVTAWCCSVPGLEGSATAVSRALSATSPRRSTLARTTTAADRNQSMSATLHMAEMLTGRSSQEKDSARDSVKDRARESARDSARISAGDSARDSARDDARDSSTPRSAAAGTVRRHPSKGQAPLCQSFLRGMLSIAVSVH